MNSKKRILNSNRPQTRTIRQWSWGALLFFGLSWASVYFLGQKSSILDTELLVDAHLIPQQALAVVSVSTQTKQWQKLQILGTAKSQQIVTNIYKQLEDNLLKPYGYDYQTQIKPWIGQQITVAYLANEQPITAENKEKQPQPSVVVIVPIANWLKLNTILASGNQKAVTQLPSTVYQETKVRSVKIKALNSQKKAEFVYFIAVIEDFAIIARDLDTIKQVIDTYSNHTSIINNLHYQDTLNSGDNQQVIARFYLNLSRTLPLVKKHDSDLMKLAPNTANQQEPSAIAGTMRPINQGVQIKGNLWHLPETETKTSSWFNFNSSLVKYLPSNTSMMLTGSNFQQLWQQWQRAKDLNLFFPLKPEIITNLIKDTTNLSWEKDFLPWMNQQFTMALIPNYSENSNQIKDYTLLMVSQVSDRAEAEIMLKQLDQLVQKRHNFLVINQASRHHIVNWISPVTKLKMNHGWLDENLLFFSLGSPITDKILPQPKLSLQTKDKFQQLRLNRLSNAQNQVFIDLETLLKQKQSPVIPLIPFQSSFWDNQILSMIPQSEEIVHSISAIGLTFNTENETTHNWRILIHFPQESQTKKESK